MSLKERLLRQLVERRQTSERLLADFQTPEQWVFQVHPSSNHALWFAGHMGQTDNFFLSLVAPNQAQPMPEFAPLFGMGSQPTNNPANYPFPQAVLATMRERRTTLLEVLNELSDDDLANKLPSGTPDFLSDVGSVFELAIWHEGVHAGQLSVARRALGHHPLS